MSLSRECKITLSITFRQILFITVLSAVIGISVNLIRSDSLVFFGDWSVEERLADKDGTSFIVPITEARALYQDKQALFLDARDKDAFEQGHIKGAKNLPWHAVDYYFNDIAATLPPETLIITYCDGETCTLSHDLANFFKDMGFENAKVLVNGWTVWQEMNLPVENGSNQPHS